MEFRSLKRILDGIDGDSDDVKIQLGNLYDLVQEHGSLADTVQTSLTSGGLVQGDLSDLRIEMDRSVCRVRQGVLRDGARYHLQDQGKGKLAAPGYEEQTEDVGGGLGGCTPPPFAPANAKDFSRKRPRRRYTSRGRIGRAMRDGAYKQLTGNYLFGLIRDLQAKVDVLTE
jgi:hypothetical protein